jgi:hypothetical protein
MVSVDRSEPDVPINRLPIRLRAYTVRNVAKRSFEGPPPLGPSDWTLTFDCETTIDAAQRLRFGAFQLRKGGVIKRWGYFYDPDRPAADFETLQAVAVGGAELITVRQFVDWIIFGRIYELGGTIIGFNLPFDLSRLAIGHGSARKGRKPEDPDKEADSSMRGGFTFRLSRNTDRPRLQVRHISSRMAFIRFGRPYKKSTPDSQKRRGLSVPARQGYFVDVRTLASTLLAEGFDLERLSAVLGVAHPKHASEEHGGPLTAEYVGYCVRDVQATWECYEALTGKLASYRLPKAEPRSMFSPASLGKTYLRAMNIRPWTEVQPDFPPELIGQIMSGYFGGRAEVHIRREIRQTLYCDFLSMYPTVCTLMGLWRFVVANGMAWHDATSETAAWLATATPADLQDQNTWQRLTVMVQLRPDDDILPVRAKYGRENETNIGLNRLTSDQPLWFTLADVLASKFLSGKTPKIDRAIAFEPMERQPDLKAVDIAGRAAYRVHPGEDDFYRTVIDRRQTVKGERDEAGGNRRGALDSEQLALKILANATSYGIFIEMIVEDLESPEVVACYGVDGGGFPTTSSVQEKPGPFFHPLLATLITGAARLMLALAEQKTLDSGLDWIFCDTDSVAIARPPEMEESEFFRRATGVCDWFTSLCPYKVAVPLLQVEEVNFAAGHKGDWTHIQPLHCFAVSSKRYALFNVTEDGAIIIRKASAHGLGHLLPPYTHPDLDTRAARIEKIKVDLWQEDLWLAIIEAARSGNANEVDLSDDERLMSPAAMRSGGSTPARLSEFRHYNQGRAYADQVKPFNFLLSFQSRKLEQLAPTDSAALAWLDTHRRDPSPAAPYDIDPDKAAAKAFDRKSQGTPVPARWLTSYARSLSRYHLSPEAKFWGGDWTESGTLRRRHVVAIAIEHVGKEANHFEEQLYDDDDEVEVEHGFSPQDRAAMVATIRAAKSHFGVRKLCREAGVSDHTLSAAISGHRLTSDRALADLVAAADRLGFAETVRILESKQLLAWAQLRAVREGRNRFAERLGVDPDNLGKVLKGGRELSQKLKTRLNDLRRGQ